MHPTGIVRSDARAVGIAGGHRFEKSMVENQVAEFLHLTQKSCRLYGSFAAIERRRRFPQVLVYPGHGLVAWTSKTF